MEIVLVLEIFRTKDTKKEGNLSGLVIKCRCHPPSIRDVHKVSSFVTGSGSSVQGGEAQGARFNTSFSQVSNLE